MSKKRPVILSPLPRNEFIGHDGKKYLDLAVDSSSHTTVTWLRRRLSDKRYFLVVAVLGGHYLKKEVSPLDARELYHALSNRLPAGEAFPKATHREVEAPLGELTLEQEQNQEDDA